jgi:hypothetical protein
MGGTEILERPQTASPSVAVVRDVYAAFERNDAPAIFALFHPEGVITQSIRLPWGGRYDGHAGLAEFLGKLTGAIASRVTTERFIDDEDGHVVATGRRFEVPETHVWTVANGLVTKFESYIDTGAMRLALGL